MKHRLGCDDPAYFDAVLSCAAWEYEGDDRTSRMLSGLSDALLRRTLFLSPDLFDPGVIEQHPGSEASWGGIDPGSTLGRALIAELHRVATSLTEVRLLIVRLNGFPECEEKFNARGDANWTWHVFDRGLQAWMGLDFLCALSRWLEEELESARLVVSEWLASLEEAGASRTTLGLLELMLEARERVEVRPLVTERVPALLPRVLAPGGQTRRFVPLT